MAVPSLTKLERNYLLEAFDSGWISSRGSFIRRAEEALQTVTAMPHATVVANGTTALHLALLATGVGPGDEVILPALSYVASLNAVLYCGAEPVLVDVNATDWCIDTAEVERAITDRTRVVMGVDLYGYPADYATLARICGSRDVAVIADAAESLGALIGGRPAVVGADVLTYSFFGNKVVTSGEGGAVLTRSDAVDRSVRQLRNQGNHPTRPYVHDVLGYNYRMTNLSAAVLTAQIERLEELITARQVVVGRYRELLAEDAGCLDQVWAPDVTPSPWMYTVRLVGCSRPQRDAVIAFLAKSGIETRPAFPLLNALPYASVREACDLADASVIADEGISLPTHPGLSAPDVNKVVANLRLALHAVSVERS
jgi:perosamine synthetase